MTYSVDPDIILNGLTWTNKKHIKWNTPDQEIMTLKEKEALVNKD